MQWLTRQLLRLDQLRPLSMRSARADTSRLIMGCVVSLIIGALVQAHVDAARLARCATEMSRCVGTLDVASQVVQEVTKRTGRERCR